MNKVILFGRLTHDPEFSQTQSQIPVVRFTVAVDRPKQKDKEKESDFVECEGWRSTAEFISRYFSKGSAIVVEGQLRNNNYTDSNGVKRYKMKVLVDNVEFGESKKAAEQHGGGQQQGYQQQQYPPPQYGAAPQQYQQAPPPPPQYQGQYQQAPPPPQYQDQQQYQRGVY